MSVTEHMERCLVQVMDSTVRARRWKHAEGQQAACLAGGQGLEALGECSRREVLPAQGALARRPGVGRRRRRLAGQQVRHLHQHQALPGAVRQQLQPLRHAFAALRPAHAE